MRWILSKIFPGRLTRPPREAQVENGRFVWHPQNGLFFAFCLCQCVLMAMVILMPVQQASARMVKLLLAGGADPHSVNAERLTPTEMAKQRGNSHLVHPMEAHM